MNGLEACAYLLIIRGKWPGLLRIGFRIRRIISQPSPCYVHSVKQVETVEAFV
ncbi:hypothetical protein DOT_3766 [Desulfosporosinus sp. OT]|nr:hypothetical protein DOT_3766 [Desulfosporosinus sp. OT]